MDKNRKKIFQLTVNNSLFTGKNIAYYVQTNNFLFLCQIDFLGYWLKLDKKVGQIFQINDNRKKCLNFRSSFKTNKSKCDVKNWIKNQKLVFMLKKGKSSILQESKSFVTLEWDQVTWETKRNLRSVIKLAKKIIKNLKKSKKSHNFLEKLMNDFKCFKGQNCYEKLFWWNSKYFLV